MTDLDAVVKKATKGKKQGKGGGARKYGQQKRSPCDQTQKARTTRNKQAEIDRQAKLAGRPDEQVSVNCLKKRQKRGRLRDFKRAMKTATSVERKKAISPSEAGRQHIAPIYP